jgi:N-acetylneuraminic acid mutarotase
MPAGERGWSVSFAIKDKGYVITGWDKGSGNYNEVWEYSQSLDTWTQKAPYPGNATKEGIGFEIGGKGYVGLGSTSSNGGAYDFWEYDPSTDTWTAKTDYPGMAHRQCVAFATGGNGYVGGGVISVGTTLYKDDFWQYNPSTDSWTQKTTFPFGARSSAFGFGINGNGYVCLGQDGVVQKSDLWQYDPQLDSWVQKANYGGNSRILPSGFVIGGTAYVGTGRELTSTAGHNDFWAYDTNTNTWSQITDFPADFRAAAGYFTINGYGYIQGGYNHTTTLAYSDLWKYTSDQVGMEVANPNIDWACYPNPVINLLNVQVRDTEIQYISLIDINGKEILKVNINKSAVLNLERFESGIYFIRLMSNDRVVTTKKIIKS